MVAELVLAFVGERVAVLELVDSFWFSFRTCVLRCCSANLAFVFGHGLNPLLSISCGEQVLPSSDLYQ